MKPIHLALSLGLLLAAGVSARAYGQHADPNAPKANGDSKGDTAPLATGPVEKTPLDDANFPPPGGATMGAGPNPNETGPIDSAKTDKK